MEAKQDRKPPGPEEPFSPADDLLVWMSRQFDRFGDIYQASAYGTNLYAIRDVGFAYHVLTENWQNYVKGQMIARVALLLGNGLMVSEGNLWKRQRRLIQPAFNHDLIQQLAKLMADVNLELLKKWRLAANRDQSVNVTHDVSGMALEVVLRFIFGEDYDYVKVYFDLLNTEKKRDMRFAQAFRSLGGIVLELVDLRTRNSLKPSDALSMLIQARDPQTGQGMESDQIIAEVLTLVVAGHETTASTLSWAWYLISQHPEVEQKLADELDSFCNFDDLTKFSYTKYILEEVMRLYPAGWLVTRRALHDDRFGEYFVPSGTEIYIAPYFIQRHPDLWAEPDHFNPDRFRPENSKHRPKLAAIPFSSGPRNCIGSHFARVEMQIHLMTIAKHLKLKYNQTRPLELEAGVNLRNKYDFIMHPEERAVVGASKPAASD
jgi:cytochrome P450